MKFLKISIQLILLFLLTSQAAIGQKQSFIDSLEFKLNTTSDTQKVEIYHTLSWATKYSNPLLAYQYAKKAHTLSIKYELKKNEAISLNRMAAAKLNLGELNEALELLLRSAEISEENSFESVLATSLRHIGKVYEAQGNTPEAMKYYYNSLSISDSLGLVINRARTALNIGSLYIQLNRLQIANAYLNYSLEAFEKDGYLRGLHEVFVLKGDYYQHRNLLDSALLSYQKALNYLTELKDNRGLAITTIKIGQVQERKGIYTNAVENYQSAFSIFNKINDKQGMVRTDIALAKAYSNLNESKKGILLAKKALKEAKLLKIPNEEDQANYVLYTIYKKINNKESALIYLENYMYLMDSLLEGEESWRVDQMRKSHDLEIQIKENELKTAIIKNQALTIQNNSQLRNFLLILIIIFILLAGTIWYALNHTKKVNKELLLANEEKNEAISLISHDLKSPFNKIKGLVHLLEIQAQNLTKDDQEVLSKINLISYEGLSLVQNLVDIKALNINSYQIKYDSFNLNDFLQKRILNFEQVAKTKHIILTFKPTTTSDHVYSDTNSIARIFDNLLSNAIKFSPEKGDITINTNISNQEFSFSVSDNGIGISKSDLDKIFKKYTTGKPKPTGTELSSGLGLSIVSSLVHKLNGKIDCESTVGQGATFSITLPQPIEGTSI